MKNNILGFGLSGLVGSRVVDLLTPDFNFQLHSRRTGTDITNTTQLSSLMGDSGADTIIHAVAQTNVDAAERDKPLKESSPSYKLTVESAREIARLSREHAKKLIYISTDFVFSGEQEFYTEEDTPNPINWYGMLKYEAEKEVLKNGGTVIRISYPYGFKKVDQKNDFVHSIIDLLSRAQTVQGVTDHFFTPTFIDDIAYALKEIILRPKPGIFHAVGPSYITPYASARAIAEVFGYNKNLVIPTTREIFFKGRAPRPFKLRLSHDKMTSLGISMHNFVEGIIRIKQKEKRT